MKDGQVSKVHTSSHEITIGPYMGSNYVNIVKTMTIDLLKNIYYDDYDTQTNTSDVELKKKNLREQNFEGEANNKLLDEEDTQRSTLDCKYLRFIFIVLYTCKVRFDIAIRSPRKRSRSV